MTAANYTNEPHEAPARGLFLPSMRWTMSPADVEAEKQRLLAARARLAVLVTAGDPLDSSATWYLMAERSLAQLDRDLDDVFSWLEDVARG